MRLDRGSERYGLITSFEWHCAKAVVLFGLNSLPCCPTLTRMQIRTLSLFLVLLLNLMVADEGQTQSPPAQPVGTKPDAPTTAPQLVQVSSAEMGKLLKKKVPPKYPEMARSNKIQGTVMLRATVSKEGNVTEVSVISGHPMLMGAALEAAKKWKYRPYQVGGKPVDVETTIQMNFQLAPY